jgi:hypothetical protein
MVVFEVKKEEREGYKRKIPFRFKEQLSPLFEHFFIFSGPRGTRHKKLQDLDSRHVGKASALYITNREGIRSCPSA